MNLLLHRAIAQQQAHDGKKLKLKLQSQNSQKSPKVRDTKTPLKWLAKKWQIFFCEKPRGFLLHILEEIRKWEKVFESNPKSTHTILFLLATICPMRKFELFCVMNRVSIKQILLLNVKKPLWIDIG